MIPADDQPVLYTTTGGRLHIPHTNGTRPLCSVETDREWQRATLDEKRGTRPVCAGCRKMAEEVPRLAELP